MSDPFSEVEPELMEVPVEEPKLFHDPAPEDLPKRKRGRPKKQAAAAEEPTEAPGDAPMPPRAGDAKEPKSQPSPSQAFKLDAEMIGCGVSALFGVIAVTSGHDHWMRTPAQCVPISDPLQRIYMRQSVAVRKQIIKYLDPGVLIAGIYQVAGPSIQEEFRLANDRRIGAIAPSVRRSPASAPQPDVAMKQEVPLSGDPGKVADLTGVLIAGVN